MHMVTLDSRDTPSWRHQSSRQLMDDAPPPHHVRHARPVQINAPQADATLNSTLHSDCAAHRTAPTPKRCLLIRGAPQHALKCCTRHVACNRRQCSCSTKRQSECAQLLTQHHGTPRRCGSTAAPSCIAQHHVVHNTATTNLRGARLVPLTSKAAHAPHFNTLGSQFA